MALHGQTGAHVRAARWIGAALLLAACKTQNPITEVVVEVESDLGAELSAIDVAVFDLDERAQGGTHRFELGPKLALPFSFSVVPGPDPKARFMVVATGSDANGEFLAQAKVIGEFTSRDPLVLALEAACRGLECERGQTCRADAQEDRGRCAAIPGLSGSIDEPEGGTGGAASNDDGGRIDAGIDGGGGTAGSAGRAPTAGEGGRAPTTGGAGAAGSQAPIDAGVDASTSDGPTIAPVCLAADADGFACDGDARVRCDADRVRAEPEDCPGNAHCVAGDPVTCACDSGYEDDGEGGCRNIDDCPSDGCGSHGTCVDELDDYSCACDTGYSGATHCDPTVCFVCSESYPCEQPATADYDCRGQFASWPMPDRVAGAQTAPGYTLATDTVTDNVTHLVWQRIVPGTYAGCTGNASTAGDTCTPAEAVEYCKGLTLAGLEWRLPTKVELESIVDHTRYRPAIDPTAFPNTTTASFWTKSRYVGGAAGVTWAVNFDGGNSTYAGAPVAARVRCVKDL